MPSYHDTVMKAAIMYYSAEGQHGPVNLQLAKTMVGAQNQVLIKLHKSAGHDIEPQSFIHDCSFEANTHRILFNGVVLSLIELSLLQMQALF